MNPSPSRSFGNGRFSKETEDLYNQFQKVLGMSEPVALLIAKQSASDAGSLSKQYFGRPTIRYLAIHEPTTSYAMAVVKVYANLEKSFENGIAPETQFALPGLLKQWVAKIDAAVGLGDGASMARRKAAARIVKCPGCKQWEFDGQIVHLENCPTKAWEKVRENQKTQPSRTQQERIKVKAAIASAKLAAKIGPPISAPSPKKSKAHTHSNWPPIIPGGGVETNRRKF